MKKTVAQWLFILCLPVLLLAASISAAVNSLGLYQYGFEKYGVSQTTGLAPAELEKAARGLIQYFNSDDELIDITVTKDGQPFSLFNGREQGHLKDVKKLFLLGYRIAIDTLIYALLFAALCLFFWQDRRRLARGLVGGGGLTMVLMLALGLGALFDFDRLFWQFHVISFANDLWQLDPATDYLIRLFPQGFWYDAAIFCMLATAAGAVILGGAGILYLEKAGLKPPVEIKKRKER